MPFLAPIGVAIAASAGATLAAGGTAAAIVGGLGLAAGGLAVAGLAKSVIGGSKPAGGGNFNQPNLPSVPSTGQASAAASQIIKDQKRRSTNRVTSTQEDRQNLLANPSTTKKTLLGS